MKKIIVALCLVVAMLTGCGFEPVNVARTPVQNVVSTESNQNVASTETNSGNQETIDGNVYSSFKKIAGDLYYNEMTKIVFIKQQTYNFWDIYTPYPAPNGLPYRYNIDTNTLEEINNN